MHASDSSCACSYTTCRFGQPISMDEYKAQFLSEIEGMPRAAVKRLTRAIERQLVETTINAPDWSVVC